MFQATKRSKSQVKYIKKSWFLQIDKNININEVKNTNPLSIRNWTTSVLELSIALMIGVPPLDDCASNNAPLLSRNSTISFCPP